MIKRNFNPFWLIGAALMAMMPTQLTSTNPVYESIRLRQRKHGGGGKSFRQGRFSTRILQDLAAINRRNGVKCAMTH